MDYEQFYRYLDTRPSSEIEACVLKVLALARKHSISVDLQSSHNQTNESLFKQHRLEVAHQVWFQHAVWNKFGSRTEDGASLKNLEHAALNLCTTSEVGEFIVSVNKSIDEKVNQLLKDDKCQTRTKYSTKEQEQRRSAEKIEQKMETATSSLKRPFKSVSPYQAHTVIQSSDEEEPPSTSAGVPNTPGTVLAAAGRALQGSATEVDSASEAFDPSPLRHHVQSTLSERSTTANTPQIKKRARPDPSNNSFWTTARDAKLAAIVSTHKAEGWTMVASLLGDGARPSQCQTRWFEHLQPLQQGLREDVDWTEAELTKLMELVPKHTIEPYYSEHTQQMTQQRIDWQAIGRVLGRVPKKCSNKYQVLDKSLRTNAPFAPHEDALIVRRELEWGDKGVGLWTNLEKELGRPSRLVRKRWKELYEMGP